MAQIPLTVSPFISLPTATTLPYTYKSIPSTLPPSVALDVTDSGKPQYVVSSGGHAAHPSDIISSCEGLEKHIEKVKTEGEIAIKEWEDSIQQRELAEKRRVAPGWLDREEKLLKPVQASQPASSTQPSNLLDRPSPEQSARGTPAIKPRSEAEELDRAFGGLDVK